jgi:hypothetical protein
METEPDGAGGVVRVGPSCPIFGTTVRRRGRSAAQPIAAILRVARVPRALGSERCGGVGDPATKSCGEGAGTAAEARRSRSTAARPAGDAASAARTEQSKQRDGS